MMQKQGFSLLELSIVLVIIGLLAGGIVGGQSLVKAAELRSVIKEFEGFTTAINAFRSKYNAYPGDMRNATRFWGRATATADCITNSSAAVASPGTCDGNGGGLVDSINVAGQSSEGYQFWKQMALAGVLEGNYTGIANATGAFETAGVNVPASKINSGGYSASAWDNSGNAADAFNYSINYGNHFMFGTSNNNAGMSGQILKPEELWNIDTKLDDGKPGSGKLFAIYWATCTTSTSATDYSGSYALTSTAVGCAIRYKM